MEKLKYKELFKAFFNFVKSAKIDYLIIGGLAINIVGEPRMTEDIDIILFADLNNLSEILEKSKKSGFTFNKNHIKSDIAHKRAFRLLYGKYHLDIILPSTEFEKIAIKRKQRVRFYKYQVFVPSPEDLIIFKIIPGRPKDLLDAESVVIRHRQKLDIKYLEKWAQWFSDEAEDITIWNNLQKVLGKQKII